MNDENPAPQGDLAPALSLFDTTFLVMGGIVGAGIFFAPHRVALEQPGWLGILVTWVLGGVIAMTGGFVFAELGGRFPRTGGQYAYLREAFGEGLAFFYGWNLLAMVASGSVAVILGVALFNLDLMLRPLFESGDKPALSVAQNITLGTLLIVVFGVVNTLGVKLGAWVHNAIMVMKLASLMGVIALGLWSFFGSTSRLELGASGAIDFRHLGAALLPALFSFGGWQNVAAVAGEVRNSARTLPKAIVLGSGAVLALYLSLNFALIAVLGVSGLKASFSPVAALAGVRLGDSAQSIVAGMVLLSTVGITQALLIMPPRIYYAMARDGLFFSACGRAHSRLLTPHVAIWLQASFALLHFWASTLLPQHYDLSTILDALVFVDWIFFAFTGAAYFVFRRRLGEPASYRAPFHPWVALFFTLSSTAVVVETVRTLELKRLAVPASLLLVGAVLWAVGRGRRSA